MKVLQQIELTKLHPHPSNPRKDLGDLTELADSIKTNGIFQNLTVVPGRWIGEEEYIKIAKAEGVTKDVAKASFDPKGMWQEDGYTVIIGHRRLAAAAIAGLETVPCVVTEMSEQEQVRTMLMENMQRSDLNYYEQAQGFQMMLDLGDTIADIAENTGFSQTTIRNRIKLMKLDPERFKKTINRQASLEDYMKLDEIEDEDLRNEVLDKIGTENFRAALKSALEAEKTKRFVADRIADVEDWATEITDTDYNRHTYVRGYNTWNWHNNTVVERPEDAGTVNYYYKVARNGIDIYTDKVEKKETEEDRQRRLRREESARREEELVDITVRHFELRQDFIAVFGAAQKFIREICCFAADAVLGNGGYGHREVDLDVLVNVLDLDIDIEDTVYEDIRKLALTAAKETPAYALLACAYAAVDEETNGYFKRNWNCDKGVSDFVYRPNEKLDRLYDFLVSLGYELSDEEKAMQSGTHKLLQNTEE